MTRDQKFKLAQRVCVMREEIFKCRWFRAKDMFRLDIGKVTGVHYFPNLVDMEGNPAPLRYTVVDDEGKELLNPDSADFGRGQFKENDLYASKSDAVHKLVEFVDEKIEELEEVKEELLNTIEEETEERQSLLEDYLFELSD